MPEPNEPEILPPAFEFPLLEDPNGVLSLFDERLSTGGLPVLDLPRIRTPSGGGLAFRVDTPGGEEAMKKLEGVLVSWRMARVYWKSRGAGKKPPDCSSTDGFTGVGDPGGLCARCPYNQFGSGLKSDGSKSSGKACKEIRQALFLLDGEMLPHLLNIPPTSIKAFSHYTMTLLSQRSRDWGAITELTLEKAQSEDQIDYAKIVFRLKRKLPEEYLGPFKLFHEQMRAALKPSIIDATAYEVAAADPVPAPRRITAPNPAGASPADPADPANPDDIPF